MFIAAVLHNFAELAVVQHAFAGIRVVVSVLIINAVVGLRKKSIVDKICVGIAIAAFLISVFADISPAIIVVAAAILGIAISCRREAKKE
jgi:chromate transporter